mgnify:CR=1 FL=1
MASNRAAALGVKAVGRGPCHYPCMAHSPAALRRKTARVVALLEPLHGRPSFKPRKDPDLVAQLVRALLSQQTTSEACSIAFARLREGTQTWDEVLALGVPEVELRIRPAGLAPQKAPRLLAILDQLREERGAITLEHLRAMDDEAALRELLRLPGVGPKTACCVLMFGMGREVLPVDTHVHRIARRLGLIDDSVPEATAHRLLAAMVAPGDRFAFHVQLFEHGRAMCRSQRPRCEQCPLRRMCGWWRAGAGESAPRRGPGTR